MNKQEFLSKLLDGLSGLPQDEIEERVSFYGEMIDDRMEEGLSEEEAVSGIGSVDSITKQIIADIPLSKIVKEKIKPRGKMKAWEIVLLVLGSPIWFSLLIAAVTVVFSLYVSLWAVLISVWAVFVSLAGCALAGIVSGIAFAFAVNTLIGFAVLGMGIVCLGLSIFAFFGCKAATKCILILTKKLAMWIKNCFVKKEEA